MPFRRPYQNGGSYAKRQKVGSYTGTSSRRRFVNRTGNTTFGRGQYRYSGFYGKQYRAPKWAMRSAGLARALGVEKKFTTDKFQDATLINTWVAIPIEVSDHSATETAGNMLMIAQGNGQSQRVGRKIMLTNISVRWVATRVAITDQEAAMAPTIVRMVWYIDRQANGAVATPSDIFTDTGEDFLQFRNLANAQRFKILKDIEVTLNPSAGAGDGTVENDWAGETKVGQFHKILNLPILYNQSATTGAIATIESNVIGCIMVSSVAEAALVTFNTRSRFTDC